MRLILISVFAVFLFSSATTVHAAIEVNTPAAQAIIIDADTGDVLFEKNADQRMPTSSMSKTATVYAVLKAIKEGRLSLTDTMRVSEKAWRKGGSKMFVEVGDDVAVEDLIKGVTVQSGNDATIVLAEELAGSEETFASSITQMANDMGMVNTNFINASGWPDDNHYSTARDLSILARRLISDFPEYYNYFSIEEFTYNDIKQPNRNPLLYRNMGVDGIKTGHTEAGGYGLMASGIRNDRRLILVVNGLDTSKQRADESARLLEWGFNSFERMTLFEKDETVSEIDVVFGQDKTIPVTVVQDVLATIYKPQRQDLKVTVEYTDPIYAPVQEGDKVGVLKVTVPGGETVSYDLVAQTGVRELGIFPKIMTKLTYMVLGKF